MIVLSCYKNIVFFTGAGISVESGVPTYRGPGGTWSTYDFEEYACQEAFDRNPDKVLEFHEMRRAAVGLCLPNSAHYAIAKLQATRPGVNIITQNIDGLHVMAGGKNVVELHGSLWRSECRSCGLKFQVDEYTSRKCGCGSYLRPNITWFGDSLSLSALGKARYLIDHCDLFISIGTSGQVFPAASLPARAKMHGAITVEVNIEDTMMSNEFDMKLRGKSSDLIPQIVGIL